MIKPSAKLSPFQIWILAIRPKTLPAAASPVILGSALALRDNQFLFNLAFATLLCALLLQIGANLANDVFDYYRGADKPGRLGPIRVTQAGLLKPSQVVMGIWIVFSVAALLGIYLTLNAGWPVLFIGFFAIFTAITYTGGPKPLGYYGLGDLFVFIFFGPVALCGTYFIQTGQVTLDALLISLPMGFLIVNILVVNNLRDIETDRLAGKMTLAVRLGEKGSRTEYLVLLVAAYLVPLGMWLSGMVSPWVNLVFLTLPMSYRLLRSIWRDRGKPLNLALAMSGRLTLFFSILFSIGLLIPA